MLAMKFYAPTSQILVTIWFKIQGS